MTIVRWSRFAAELAAERDESPVQHRVRRAVGNPAAAMRRWVPAMDLVESGEQFVLRADLPGMSEEDIRIELEDGTLSVSGERKAEHEQREQGFHRVERSFGGLAAR